MKLYQVYVLVVGVCVTCASGRVGILLFLYLCNLFNFNTVVQFPDPDD